MSAAHTIRPARLEDAPALQQIYAHYVEQTAYSFEYQPPTPQEFQARIAATLQAYPYLVAEVEGTPLAMPMRAGCGPGKPMTGWWKPPFTWPPRP